MDVVEGAIDGQARGSGTRDAADYAAGACAALSLIGVLIWQWHAIRGWLATLGGTWQSGGYAAYSHVASRVQDSSMLVLVSAGAFVVFLAVAAYLIWAEEK
jgi:hypothetical protein